MTQIGPAPAQADVVELRLDYLDNIDLPTLAHWRRELQLPLILTLRNLSQGGFCELTEDQRLNQLKNLTEALAPEYVDLEYSVPPQWLQQFRNHYPNIQIIGSYHNFTETPSDLDTLWHSLYNPYFDIVKIATFAQDICDALRLLIFLKSISKKHAVIGIAMGEYGQISRILAPIAGSLFTYGCIREDLKTAPGQLTLQELTDIYRVHSLNENTAIYALLGDPIAQSPGHLFHNQFLAAQKKNAVYIKCRVHSARLAQTMALLRVLKFDGLSITIPHKETIVPLLDELHGDASMMKIVNTVKRKGCHYTGFNTDATAAVDILEKLISLPNQRVLILGAGGSGKAIAYALLAKDAKITLCNRSLARAQNFTEKFGGKSSDFKWLFTQNEFLYDIIINTLPAAAFIEQCKNWKIPPNPQGIALDIVLQPLHTPFIQLAKTAGWQCLTGETLFTAQAENQLTIWHGSQQS